MTALRLGAASVYVRDGRGPSPVRRTGSSLRHAALEDVREPAPALARSDRLSPRPRERRDVGLQLTGERVDRRLRRRSLRRKARGPDRHDELAPEIELRRPAQPHRDDRRACAEREPAAAALERRKIRLAPRHAPFREEREHAAALEDRQRLGDRGPVERDGPVDEHEASDRRDDHPLPPVRAHRLPVAHEVDPWLRRKERDEDERIRPALVVRDEHVRAGRRRSAVEAQAEEPTEHEPDEDPRDARHRPRPGSVHERRFPRELSARSAANRTAAGESVQSRRWARPTVRSSGGSARRTATSGPPRSITLPGTTATPRPAAAMRRTPSISPPSSAKTGSNPACWHAAIVTLRRW